MTDWNTSTTSLTTGAPTNNYFYYPRSSSYRRGYGYIQYQNYVDTFNKKNKNREWDDEENKAV